MNKDKSAEELTEAKWNLIEFLEQLESITTDQKVASMIRDYLVGEGVW